MIGFFTSHGCSGRVWRGHYQHTNCSTVMYFMVLATTALWLVVYPWYFKLSNTHAQLFILEFESFSNWVVLCTLFEIHSEEIVLILKTAGKKLREQQKIQCRTYYFNIVLNDINSLLSNSLVFTV